MATASRVCEAFILYFQLSWVSLYLPKAMYHLHRMDCSLVQYGSSHSTVKVRFSFREVGVCHDPYFLSAAGIGGQVLGGERYVYPELLERHDLFQRHELEFFLVTVYPGPESHVFQGSGTIETELETVLVVHSELKRPADVEAALAGVEINILGFIVIQQVIRVVRVIIRFGQPDGQFVVCHVSFSGNRKFVLFAAGLAVKAYLLKSTGWWKKVFSSSVFIRITFKFEIITLLEKGCKNNCFGSDGQRTCISFCMSPCFLCSFIFLPQKK